MSRDGKPRAAVRARDRLTDLALEAVLWVCTAALAWLVVLTVELAWTRPDRALETLVATGLLALGYSAMLSVPLIFLHLGRRWLLPTRARLTLIVTAAAVGAIASLPGWSQSAWLTSGETIGDHPHRLGVRLAILAIFILLWVGLWLWHAIGVSDARAGKGDPTLASSFGWHLLGLVVLMALLWLVSSGRLDTYARLATTILPAAWLIAATIAHRWLRGHPRLRRGAAAAVTALCIAAVLQGDDARERASTYRHTRTRLSAHTALSTAMVAQSEDPLGLTLGHVPARCPQEGLAAPRTKLDLPSDRRRNVILISIDALRADAVDWQHNGMPIAPQLSEFRKRAIDFKRAVTTYPATIFSLAGALTGLAPAELAFGPSFPSNVFTILRSRFDRRFISLPDNEWFRKPAIDQLLVQGTPVSHRADSAEQTTEFIDTLEAARNSGERLMAWIHYYDPHAPYRSHEDFDLGPGKRAAYMSEIAFVDRQIGRILQVLEQGGWFEDSLVVVFSDHGQALGELGYYGHHVYLNGFISDIVLYARWPGVAPSATPALVDIRDVASTIGDFVGQPHPKQAGRSLLASSRDSGKHHSIGEAFPIRGAELFYMAANPVASITELRQRVRRFQTAAHNYEPKTVYLRDDYRLIVHRGTGVRELYLRSADPNEANNLASSHRRLADQLTNELQRHYREQYERIYCAILDR